MAKSRADLELRATDKATRVLQRFQKNLGNVNRNLRRAENRFKLMSQRVDATLGSVNRLGTGMRTVGRSMSLFVTLPVAAAGGAAINEFRKFEKAVIGVGKTTGIQGPKLQALGQEFIKMSKTIPLSATELAALGEAAGQMGISAETDILAFTEAMAKLQFTTDVAGEEGARAIARILAVTREGPGAIKPFADTLVFLGNTLEATESEILGVANRIAGNTSRFNISSNQILVLAGAFKALGKESELVGSVTGKVFNQVQQAILKGGDGLKTLRTLTGGLTQKQLKEQFQTKPVELFLNVLKGLQKVSQSKTGNFLEVIGSLGLEGVRVNDILGTATTSLDKFQKKMGEIDAGKQIGALDKEFGAFLKSLDSDIITTTNVVKALAISVGKTLAPMFKKFLGVVRTVSTFLINNPGFTKFLVVTAAIAAVVGPLLFILGSLLVAFVKIRLAMLVLPAVIPLISSLGALTIGSLAPLLLLAVTLGAVAAAAFEINKAWPSLQDSTLAEWLDFINHEFENLLENITKVANVLTGGALEVTPEQKALSREKATPGGFGSGAVGGGILGLPRKLPVKDTPFPGRDVNVKQSAELSIKVEGTSGTTAKVKDQKGFDKISINRGFQGGF